VKRLVFTEIARADLASIRRYSTRTWGQDRTTQYMDALRDTMKSLVRGRVTARNREDLRPGISMATSGRHCIFFEADDSRILVVRVLHDRMDYRRHLHPSGAPGQDN
jgi:toxin ParE1/3/4